jgi:hypothetical protein
MIAWPYVVKGVGNPGNLVKVEKVADVFTLTNMTSWSPDAQVLWHELRVVMVPDVVEHAQ